VQNWAFLGGSITSTTEVTEARSIRVRSTTVSYRDDGPWPTQCDDTLPLCRTCWLAVMEFLGVGRRRPARAAEGDGRG
jgi:hypothetical protein